MVNYKTIDCNNLVASAIYFIQWSQVETVKSWALNTLCDVKNAFNFTAKQFQEFKQIAKVSSLSGLFSSLICTVATSETFWLHCEFHLPTPPISSDKEFIF